MFRVSGSLGALLGHKASLLQSGFFADLHWSKRKQASRCQNGLSHALLELGARLRGEGFGRGSGEGVLRRVLGRVLGKDSQKGSGKGSGEGFSEGF